MIRMCVIDEVDDGNTEREGGRVCLYVPFSASAWDPQAKAINMVNEMLAVHCLSNEIVTLFHSIAMILL